jgi:hypothetical protein
VHRLKSAARTVAVGFGATPLRRAFFAIHVCDGFDRYGTGICFVAWSYVEGQVGLASRHLTRCFMMGAELK